VLLEIRQNVHEATPHFARRRETPSVKSVTPHPFPATEDAIDRLCDADHQSLDASREGRGFVGFHHQVDVVGLHAEMHDPKRSAGRGAQRAADRAEHVVGAQGR
jgi:hypothetical protein